LNKLLPDGAQINILVRTAQLAQSPHAAELRQTIRAVPGFELYFGESGFDPLTDFETMLVRTTDLSSLTHTLIVATLAIADERAEATMRRLPQPDQTVSWRRDRENRWTQAHLPPGREGNLSWAILRDKQNHYLAGPAPWVTHVLEAPTELTEDEATQQLAAVRLDGEPAHLALVTPSSQLFVAPGVPRGQATSGLLVAAHFGPSPRIVARQWFTDRSTARRFLERLRQRLSSLHRHPLAGLLDVTSLVENVEFHQQDSQVTAYLPLEAAQLRRLLTVAVLILDGGRRNHEAPTNPN
jgi:plasmid stabilization system protein ParE